jgi:hypothetical protein
MTETSQLKLPLLQPSQAQKHVTVNEALLRLDAVAQLRLLSRSLIEPPAVVAEGAVYAVPASPVNAWAGQAGKIALYANEGWIFVAPRTGWRAWIVDERKTALFDGVAWQAGALAVSAKGAATRCSIIELDHAITPGAISSTDDIIPAYAQVIGVTGRILTAITGTVTTWRLGVPGGAARYASGLGKDAGSWIIGMSSTPMTYYEVSRLRLTAESGEFAGGLVRLSIHCITLDCAREG